MCEFDVKNQPRGHSAGQGSDAGLVRIRLTALRAVHSEQASNLRPAAQEARSRRGGCPRGLQAVRGTGSRLFAALTCPRVCPLPGGRCRRPVLWRRPVLLRQDCGLSRAAPRGSGTFTSGRDSHHAAGDHDVGISRPVVQQEWEQAETRPCRVPRSRAHTTRS